MAAPFRKVCNSLGNKLLQIDALFSQCKLTSVCVVTQRFVSDSHRPGCMIAKTLYQNQGPINPHCSSNERYLRTVTQKFATPLSPCYDYLEPNVKYCLSRTKNLSSSAQSYGHLRKIAQKSSSTQLVHNVRSTANEMDIWNLRLANENGYLSSCRNAYISVIAGATVYAQHGLVTYGQEAGVLLIWLGGINLLWGTWLFLYHSLKLRRLIAMSRMSLLAHWIMALTHLLIWIGSMAIYLEYVEDEEKKGEIHDL